MSIDEVEVYCKANKYKLSNAERRLRPSESPMIAAVEEKGYIVGYRTKRPVITLPPAFKVAPLAKPEINQPFFS